MIRPPWPARRRSEPGPERPATESHERGWRNGTGQGFGVTFRQMFRPRLTTEYPDEKRPKPERFHGRHVLNRYEDGMEKCIGCELCAGVCPARCIYVRGADNPPDAPVSPGERYGFVYEINYLRCIHCDLCVEACPTEAITETKLFEFSFTNREDAIYTKSELLVGDDGRASRMPWELWMGGEDDHTSAWMRATAPSGDVDYEGRIAWSGELGFGERLPEDGQRPPRPHDRAGTDPPRRRWTRGTDGVLPLLPLRRHRARRRARRRARGEPGPLGAVARDGADLDRGALRGAGRAAARRGAGHRLRGRDRRALPVRDHAARRRPQRVDGGDAADPADRPRSCSALALPATLFVAHQPTDWATGEPSLRGVVAPHGGNVKASPRACSPRSSGRSSSPRCCS